MKEQINFLGKSFQPGTNFSYLGFKFIFPNYKSILIDKGKFTKLRYTPITLRFTNLSKFNRSSIFILITSTCFKRLKNKLKLQLNRKNSILSVKKMIDKINLILWKNLIYFSIVI
jgi:hypothetical protein